MRQHCSAPVIVVHDGLNKLRSSSSWPPTDHTRIRQGTQHGSAWPIARNDANFSSGSMLPYMPGGRSASEAHIPKQQRVATMAASSTVIAPGEVHLRGCCIFCLLRSLRGFLCTCSGRPMMPEHRPLELRPQARNLPMTFGSRPSLYSTTHRLSANSRYGWTWSCRKATSFRREARI